jgi:hypothetical protein
MRTSPICGKSFFFWWGTDRTDMLSWRCIFILQNEVKQKNRLTKRNWIWLKSKFYPRIFKVSTASDSYVRYQNLELYPFFKSSGCSLHFGVWSILSFRWDEGSNPKVNQLHRSVQKLEFPATPPNFQRSLLLDQLSDEGMLIFAGMVSKLFTTFV